MINLLENLDEEVEVLCPGDRPGVGILVWKVTDPETLIESQKLLCPRCGKPYYIHRVCGPGDGESRAAQDIDCLRGIQ